MGTGIKKRWINGSEIMIIALVLLSVIVVVEAVWLKRLKKEIERKEVKINMLECVIMKLKKG
ncbi:hypothetical protein [Acetobacterium wieringae]|jgi:type II secretory pathway component PulJ|nr:hypothetical protein [Acetobacterium wieringae]